MNSETAMEGAGASAGTNDGTGSSKLSAAASGSNGNKRLQQAQAARWQSHHEKQLRQSKRRRKRRRQYDESSSNEEEKDKEATLVDKPKARNGPAATSRSQQVVASTNDNDVDEEAPITNTTRNAAKLEPFDVSTLLPLTRNTQNSEKPKTRIELICKLTGSVHVVFPSVDLAAQALGTTRKMVRRACRAFTSSPIDEETELAFPTCQLRHVLESSAYEYGAHSRDFALCDETHDERLERWAKLKETDSYVLQKANIRAGSTGMRGKIEVDNFETSASSQFSAGATKRRCFAPTTNPEPDARKDKNKMKHEQQFDHHACEGRILKLLAGSTIWEQPIVPEPGDTEKESRGNSGNDEQIALTLCVACQAKQARVVLRPCHHCVICRDCAVKWCPVFCPKCNTKIQERLFPEQSILFIQPAFLSGFSFF